MDASSESGHAAAPDRPDILVILTDQWNPRMMGCAGGYVGADTTSRRFGAPSVALS